MIDQLTTTVTTTVNDALDRAKLQLSKVATLDLTKLDLTKLDPRKVDLSRFGVSKLDVTKLDPRNVDLSRLDVSKLDLPVVADIDVPAAVERVADAARDAVYAGVGAAVIVAERIDAQMRDTFRRAA